MAWGSTAAAAMDGLIATLQPVSARVIDSAVVSNASGPEVVNVGWQTEDQLAIEATVDPDVPAADLEKYTINNAVRVLKAKDLVAARVRALALLGEVGTAIKADRTLGGSVMRAWISAWSFELSQGRGGALATILFSVDCDEISPRPPETALQLECHTHIV